MVFVVDVEEGEVGAAAAGFVILLLVIDGLQCGSEHNPRVTLGQVVLETGIGEKEEDMEMTKTLSLSNLYLH